MLKRMRESSPCFEPGLPGGLFLLVILAAAFTQFFVRGRLGFAADLTRRLHRGLGRDRCDAALLWHLRREQEPLFARGILQLLGTRL